MNHHTRRAFLSGSLGFAAASVVGVKAPGKAPLAWKDAYASLGVFRVDEITAIENIAVPIQASEEGTIMRNIRRDDMGIASAPELNRNKASPPEISYDPITDIISIDYYRFAREIFTMIATEDVGTMLKIAKRADGVVLFERVPPLPQKETKAAPVIATPITAKRVRVTPTIVPELPVTVDAPLAPSAPPVPPAVQADVSEALAEALREYGRTSVEDTSPSQ